MPQNLADNQKDVSLGMKISIRNFKAIRELNDYEIKPMNILSGANSTGKTSFIQLLLLIKQTLEYGRNDGTLRLKHDDLVDLGSFNDILNNSSLNNSIMIEISDKSIIKFTINNNRETKISNISFIENNFSQFELQVKKNDEKSFFGTYYFSDSIHKFSAESEIYYKSMFPLPQGIIAPDAYTLPLFQGYYSSIIKFESLFKKMYYIGPLRSEPKGSYEDEESIEKWVGKHGQYFAILMSKEENNKIIVYDTDHQACLENFGKAINYWICKIFNMCRKVESIESRTETSKSYSVQITNFEDKKVSIKHVGFGFSQILPIVVQGLLLEDGDIFILEQPEIHLHPKIQSLLFDFLYSLTLKGVRIIVETHSDHFINRMLRRVAEDPTDTLAEKMNLTFMDPSNQNGDSLFHPLHISEYGSLDVWPKDFFDQYDEDSREIVKAQAAKRRAKLQQKTTDNTPAS